MRFKIGDTIFLNPKYFKVDNDERKIIDVGHWTYTIDKDADNRVLNWITDDEINLDKTLIFQRQQKLERICNA